MNGTAANYMNGNLLLGSTTDGGQKLQVTGDIRLSGSISTTANNFTIQGNSASQFYNINTSTGVTTIGENVAINLNFNGSIFSSFRRPSAGGSERFLMISNTGSGLPATPVANAVLQLYSTNAGFLPPRMTNAQMVAIASPGAGLMVYDTTNNKLNVYDGTNWVAVH
jgi:hypothetical protein